MKSAKDKIEDSLNDRGWKMVYDGDMGFTYLKKRGSYGGVQKVLYSYDDNLLSFDPEIPSITGNGNMAVELETEDLLLFYKRIKEWKKTYGEI